MRVTEKRKKEIGDKGLKKERKKERKVMVCLFTVTVEDV